MQKNSLFKLILELKRCANNQEIAIKNIELP